MDIKMSKTNRKEIPSNWIVKKMIEDGMGTEKVTRDRRNRKEKERKDEWKKEEWV